ncbi:MAG TPA: hypothetical protein VJ946_02430, partial [Bacteroidales bacterium]|nr:hypothetical protein [Bacteroidales bacterium]
MHFSFVIFRYFPFGGLQRSMQTIALACVAAGHAVTVYTTKWEGEKLPGVDVVELPINAATTAKRDKKFAGQFLNTINTSQTDLVVGFNKIPGLDVYYSGDTCYAVKAHEKHGLFYRMTARCRTNLKLEEIVFAKGLKTRILIVAENLT